MGKKEVTLKIVLLKEINRKCSPTHSDHLSHLADGQEIAQKLRKTSRMKATSVPNLKGKCLFLVVFCVVVLPQACFEQTNRSEMLSYSF